MANIGTSKNSLSVMIFSSLFALNLCLATEPSIAKVQDDQIQSASFIQSLADKAISVLRNQKGTLEEREKKFQLVLQNDFALKKIGRFTAGKYWRKMNVEQKKLFQGLFEKWIVKTYAVRFGGYSGETVRVVKTMKAGRKDVFVRTKIVNRNKKKLNVDWRVRRINSKLKIVDVVIQGVSMLVTQKAEFSAIFRQRGIDGLIRILRAQLVKLDEATFRPN